MPAEKISDIGITLKIGQQLAFAIEDLQAVFHLVGDPDVAVASPLRCPWAGRSMPGPSPCLPKQADEVSVGIEDLHAIVERVGHVDISVLIQGHALRRAEVAGRGEEVILSAGADAAQQLERVGVVDDDLVLLRIDDVEKAVRGIEGDAHRIDQARR
jgi:hypothetical protein